MTLECLLKKLEKFEEVKVTCEETATNIKVTFKLKVFNSYKRLNTFTMSDWLMGWETVQQGCKLSNGLFTRDTLCSITHNPFQQKLFSKKAVRSLSCDYVTTLFGLIKDPEHSHTETALSSCSKRVMPSRSFLKQ